MKRCEDGETPVGTGLGPSLQICWHVPVLLPAPAGLEMPGPGCGAGAIPTLCGANDFRFITAGAAVEAIAGRVTVVSSSRHN